MEKKHLRELPEEQNAEFLDKLGDIMNEFEDLIQTYYPEADYFSFTDFPREPKSCLNRLSMWTHITAGEAKDSFDMFIEECEGFNCRILRKSEH